MKAELIVAELRRLLTEAESLEARLGIHIENWALFHHEGEDACVTIDHLIEKDHELMEPFKYLASSLYLSTVCLLDILGLSAYLAQFYQKFGEQFNAKVAAENFVVDHYVSEQRYNKFLLDLQQFLSPLGILDDVERYIKLSGIRYLETILKNTATIIEKTGITPTSEVEVYKAVKDIFEIIFPSAKFPKSNFIKIAQEYKPDILIPDLHVAIEYKYAVNATKLKATIAQISDDVKGYTGDDDYKLFYAVFYVTKSFWTKEKFKAAWDEKKFPKNWRAFYIVGR